MSKADVYNQLSISDGIRNQIAGFNRTHLERIYASGVRDARVQVGYVDAKVSIAADAEALATVKGHADQTADRIQRVTNDRLKAKLAKLPDDATDEELHAGLAEWKQGVLEHNRDRLIPFIEKQATVMGQRDFLARNGIKARGVLMPSTSHSPPSDICVDVLARGEMDMGELTAYDWPAHNSCPHMPVMTSFTGAPPEAQAWPLGSPLATAEEVVLGPDDPIAPYGLSANDYLEFYDAVPDPQGYLHMGDTVPIPTDAPIRGANDVGMAERETIAKYAGLEDKRIVSNFQEGWLASTLSKQGLAMQRATEKMTGAPLTSSLARENLAHLDKTGGAAWDAMQADADKVVRGLYAAASEQYVLKNVKELALARGARYAPGSVPDVLEHLPVGGEADVEVGMNPLSSWTGDRAMAEHFAGGAADRPVAGEQAYVFTASVPVNRIMGSGVNGLTRGMENEHVVIGGERIRLHVKRVR